MGDADNQRLNLDAQDISERNDGHVMSDPNDRRSGRPA